MLVVAAEPESAVACPVLNTSRLQAANSDSAGSSGHGLVICITKLHRSPGSDKELKVAAPHFNLIASLNTDA